MLSKKKSKRKRRRKSDEIESKIENPVTKSDVSKARAAEKVSQLEPEESNQDSQKPKVSSKSYFLFISKGNFQVATDATQKTQSKSVPDTSHVTLHLTVDIDVKKDTENTKTNARKKRKRSKKRS